MLLRTPNLCAPHVHTTCDFHCLCPCRYEAELRDSSKHDSWQREAVAADLAARAVAVHKRRDDMAATQEAAMQARHQLVLDNLQAGHQVKVNRACWCTQQVLVYSCGRVPRHQPKSGNFSGHCSRHGLTGRLVSVTSDVLSGGWSAINHMNKTQQLAVQALFTCSSSKVSMNRASADCDLPCIRQL